MAARDLGRVTAGRGGQRVLAAVLADGSLPTGCASMTPSV
jgi:hypothetical protein